MLQYGKKVEEQAREGRGRRKYENGTTSFMYSIIPVLPISSSIF